MATTYTHMHNFGATSTSLIQYYIDATREMYSDRSNKDIYSSLYYVLSFERIKLHPLLVLHGNQLFNGELEEALPGAIAVELFHKFTYVHQDIMYGIGQRQGLPSVHEKYGLGTAINTGDLLMIMAYQHINMVKSEYHSEAFGLYNQFTARIMEGQSMDLEFGKRQVVSTKEYLNMIELRSSMLFSFCLRLGALLAGASLKDQELMFELGRSMGLGYHIKSDWRNLNGQNPYGELPERDIDVNNTNFLKIKAWELADEKQKKRLLKLQGLKNDGSKSQERDELYDELNIDAITKEVIEEYYAKAIGRLDAISADKEKKQSLSELTEAICLL